MSKKYTPPRVTKTIKDLIFWRYSKIIANSSGFGRKNFGFITNKFKQLQNGEIIWSSAIREYLREKDNPNACIYCGSIEKLTIEHILPISMGGPDITDNVIMVCKSCNSSKGKKKLYEWYGLNNREDIPRIAEGKYLKLLYMLHEQRGTLLTESIKELCPDCNLRKKCEESETVEVLTIYCLEGIFNLK